MRFSRQHHPVFHHFFLRPVVKQNVRPLSVLATVVGAPTSGKAVVDAGSNVLSADLIELQGHEGASPGVPSV